MDTSVERAQLASTTVRRNLALVNVNRSRALMKDQLTTQIQLDSDEAQVKSSETEAQTIQAQIARKIVRAPFSGRLGIRAVNVGQYLNPGTTLTVLQAVGAVYVDFFAPQQQLGTIIVGMPVKIQIEGSSGPPQDGVIAMPSIRPSIAPHAHAQAARHRAESRRQAEPRHVRQRGGAATGSRRGRDDPADCGSPRLVRRLGVRGREQAKADAPGARTSPSGKTIKNARQQFVRLGVARGDYVAVLDGVTDGQELVTAGAFKLRNNSPIVVDNSVKTDPQLNPKPENH